MSIVNLNELQIIGLQKRTSNDPGKGEVDIPTLWGTFMGNNIMEQIPNKVNNDIYAIYTDYEGDHSKPYTFILGCHVSSLENVPEGMRGITIPKVNYDKRTVRGNLQQGVIFNAWLDIWKSDLNRAYQADFEVYGKNAGNAEDAEVDIFVSLKENA